MASSKPWTDASAPILRHHVAYSRIVGGPKNPAMERRPSPTRALHVLAVLATAATFCAAFGVSARRSHASSDLPVIGHVPAFAIPDQRGRIVSGEILRGQVLVVNFFYATCTTSCPLLTGRMRSVQGAIARREEQLERPLPIHLISITLDPENDTPDVLRAYAERVGADENRWSFLSGRSEDLDRIVVRGFKSTFQRADPSAGIGTIMHGEWLVLVDGAGSLRGFYAASNPARMQSLVTDAIRLARGSS